MHMDTSNAYLKNSNREPKNTLPVFCDTLAKLKSDKHYLPGKGHKTQKHSHIIWRWQYFCDVYINRLVHPVSDPPLIVLLYRTPQFNLKPRCHNWVHKISRIHYSDIIMSAMASQITGVSIVYSTVRSGVDQRKYQSSVTLRGGFTGYRWLPAQRVSNAKNVSMSWRHHDWYHDNAKCDAYKCHTDDMGTLPHCANSPNIMLGFCSLNSTTSYLKINWRLGAAKFIIRISIRHEIWKASKLIWSRQSNFKRLLH